jgi:anti-anti-sigma regulatory factor
MAADDISTNPDASGTSPGRVVLGGSCTIHEVAAIKAHMLEQFARPAPYEIDGTAVERLDAVGVQLLVAFALDCLERNLAYAWTGRSAVLEQAITLLGVGPLLESPGLATSAAGS